MTTHAMYKYSVTIKTDDLAVVHCLRGLSQFDEQGPKRAIPWGHTKESDWMGDNKQVTFRFSSPVYRDAFVKEVGRLLPLTLWSETKRSDSDPASRAR